MIGRELLHQLREIHLRLVPGIPGRRLGGQILYQLEHADDMAFTLLAEFCQQQDHRCQQALCGVVEKGILPVIARITAANVDDGFRCDLGVFLRLCLCAQILRIRQIHVHVLVHEMQNVVLIRAGGVTQIQHRDIVAVILFGDISIISSNVPLGIG